MYLHSLHSLYGFNSLCGWPLGTKGTIPIAMYLHWLCFTAWVSNPYMGLHYSHVPTFTEFYCMGSIPCVGDLFALRDYPNHHVTIFTAFHCMVFNSSQGSPPLLCTYIHYFAIRALSPPPFTYIYCVLLHGFNSLFGWPFCTKNTIPTTMYLHSLHFTSTCCNSLHGSPALSCTHIHCVHCVGSIHCVGPLKSLRNAETSLQYVTHKRHKLCSVHSFRCRSRLVYIMHQTNLMVVHRKA